MALTFNDYVRMDATALAAHIRSRQFTALEVLEAAISRANQVDGKLNAIIHRLDETAHAAAVQARARAQTPAAAFAGVPFLIKNLFQELAGAPATCGSLAIPAKPCSLTADITRRWQSAGLNIFGITNSPEFGSKNVTEPLAYGPTRNPWDLNRTPGGSSGGSAAAVAAGIVPVAGANDGGGSIRIPAAACGLFGFKPARGRVSMGPTMGEALNGAAVHGVLSRSVRDSAALLDIMQGPEPHAPYYYPTAESSYANAISVPPRRLRIGFSSASPIGTPVHAEAVTAVHEAARLLESLGHHVEAAEPKIDGFQMSQDFLLCWFCQMAYIVTDVRAKTGAKVNQFEPDTRAMAAAGRSVKAVELLRAQTRWHEYILRLSEFHQQYDLWMSPVLSEPPLTIGQLETPAMLHTVNALVNKLGLTSYVRRTTTFKNNILKNLAWTPYTQLANLTGRPAMSVPLHWTAENLPMGVQFVGPLNSETWMLQLAAELEVAQPWFNHQPTL